MRCDFIHPPYKGPGLYSLMYAFDFGVDLEKNAEVIPFHKFLLHKRNSNSDFLVFNKESQKEKGGLINN